VRIRLILHHTFGVLAAACALAFIGLGAALEQYFDPDRSLDDKLTNWFTPNRRRRDFIGPGWRLQKLQWLSLVLLPVFLALWGSTSE
jgi:hypothetical protein